MTITQETVKELIKDMRLQGKTDEEIDTVFKDALQAKMISLDMYFKARDLIPQIK